MQYLLSRTMCLLPGSPLDSMAWSVRLTEKFNEVGEAAVTLWSTLFSPSSGALVWTTVADDLAVLEASDTKLMSDPGYLSLMEAAGRFVADEGFDDRLVQLVVGGDGAMQADYATVVQSVLVPGRAARGIETGGEIARRAERVTGRSSWFGVTTTGPYGGAEWITMYDSLDELQHMREALSADTDFAAFLDEELSQAFQCDATSQTVYRRVA